MTRDEIELMLTDLAETTRYLEETTRVVRSAATRLTVITARLLLHGDKQDPAKSNLEKLIQADIERLREARGKPAVRTHGDLTEDVARLEKLLLELQTDIRALRDRKKDQHGDL